MSALKRIISRSLSLSTFDQCDLNSVEDQNSWVTTDGFYASSFRINGARQVVCTKSHEDMIQDLYWKLKDLFRTRGRQIQFVFTYDPFDGAQHKLKTAFAPKDRKSTRLNSSHVRIS